MAMAATDPANPYGAALPWPAATDGASLARAAGAHVVLLDGQPALYLERGGRSLHTLPAAAREGALEAGLEALAGLVVDGRLRSLEIGRVDGLPPADTAWRGRLEDAGWRAAYRGWVPSSRQVRPGARYHRADV